MSRYIPGHDHKLVPTPSTQYIGGTQGALECLTNRFENSVPNQMAIGVVDSLEAVDIDQDQAVGPIKKLDLLNTWCTLRSMYRRFATPVRPSEYARASSSQALFSKALFALLSLNISTAPVINPC